MAHFNQKPGTRSSVHHFKNLFSDISSFDRVIQSLVLENPLGCTSYMSLKRNHPPVEIVRQRYTAKFVYLNESGMRIGTGSDMYDSVEGYQNGIAAIISNLANREAHRGKVRHIPSSDLFSVIMKCHDPNGELYFLSMARNRVTLSSYEAEEIRSRFGDWVKDLTVKE